MPSFKFLLQGREFNKDHISAITYLSQLENIERIIISVAFIRKAGLDLIERIISPFFDKIEIFVGIRNGITSVQAILSLINKEIYPMVVDTASPSHIFHPKVFLAYSTSKARLIVGSANLTLGGLVNNIEASSIIDFDLSQENEKNHLDEVISSFLFFSKTYPENVFRVTNRKQAYLLYKEGRLIDERIISHPSVAGRREKNDSDDIKRIRLPTRRLKREIKKKTKKPKITVLPSADSIKNEWLLLWESKPLTERDLNIPSSSRTHATGSMLFKKGNFLDIDQRHYFRDEIFKEIKWEFDSDPKYGHLERASVHFGLIIRGISYGVYNLKLTHNSRTDSRSYKQNNAMTQIDWGPIREFISRRNLMGCVLKLYQPIERTDIFIIEIE